jgi:hypothetical protein
VDLADAGLMHEGVLYWSTGRSDVSWRRWQHSLIDAVFDESRDAHYFPGQEWDPPFAPEARDGSFV